MDLVSCGEILLDAKLDILKELFEKGQYLQVLEQIEYFRSKYASDPDFCLEIDILKLTTWEKMEKFQEALELSSSLLEQLDPDSSSSHFQVSKIYLGKAKIMFNLGKLKNLRAIIESATDHLLLAVDVPLLEFSMMEAEIFTFSGAYYWRLGNMQEALSYMLKNLEICEKLGSKNKLANAYNNVGIMHNALGDLNTGLTNFKLSYAINQEISNEREFHNASNNIAAILIQLGKLDESLKYQLPALEYYRKEQYRQGIITTLWNIGEVYWHKREYRQALSHLDESYELIRESGNVFSISGILIPLCLIHLEMKSSEKVNPYLTILEDLHQKEKNKLITHRYFLVKALVLDKIPQIQTKAQAQNMLLQIINDDIVDYDLTMLALVAYCDTIIAEYQIFQDLSVLDFLTPILDNLLLNAREIKSYKLLAEVLLFKAKFSLISARFSQARSYFSQAQTIAERHGLQRLAKKISHMHDGILEKASKLALLEQDPQTTINLQELIEIFDLSDNFRTYVHSKSTQAQDDSQMSLVPQIFQIFKPNGIPIYTKSFNDENIVDGSILGGFLSSLNIVLSQYFSEKLDRVRFGDYTAILQSFNDLIILLVFKGQSYSANQLVSTFISRANQSPEIKNFLSKAAEMSRTIYTGDLKQFDELLYDILRNQHLEGNLEQ